MKTTIFGIATLSFLLLVSGCSNSSDNASKDKSLQPETGQYSNQKDTSENTFTRLTVQILKGHRIKFLTFPLSNNYVEGTYHVKNNILRVRDEALDDHANYRFQVDKKTLKFIGTDSQDVKNARQNKKIKGVIQDGETFHWGY